MTEPRIDRMVLHFASTKPKPYRRQVGDIKVKGDEYWECCQKRYCGMDLVNNGRAVLEWVPLTATRKLKLSTHRFRTSRYAASGKKLNGKPVDFSTITC